MKLRLALTAFAMIAAACGGAIAEIAPTTTAGTEVAGSGDTMEDMEGMDAMNMGDPNAVAAADVGGDLVSGSFRILDSASEALAEVTGTADLARHDNGTTVTIGFENLVPMKEYVAHVHAGSCFDDGGPHYQFEVGGSDMPPNEIHLAFTSHADGSGSMTAENHQVAGPDATAIVVHENSAGAPKLACADLK